MTTPNPDPAVVAADRIGRMPNLKLAPRGCTEQAIEDIIRAAYAPHMKAAEEMAKALEQIIAASTRYFEERVPSDDPDCLNPLSQSRIAVARWRELNPEVKG